MKKKLTPKENLFCGIYLTNDYNATQAYKDAGYKWENDNVAAVCAYKMLRKPKIKDFLAKKMKKVEEKLDITFEKKAELLWKCAQKAYGTNEEQMEKILSAEVFTREDVMKLIVPFHPSGLVGAVSELNKMQGHYHQPKEAEPEDKEKLKTLIKENEREF